MTSLLPLLWRSSKRLALRAAPAATKLAQKKQRRKGERLQWERALKAREKSFEVAMAAESSDDNSRDPADNPSNGPYRSHCVV